MSDVATSTFVGVLVVVLMAIKYWRIALGVLAAILITALIMGVRQLVVTMEQQTAPASVQSHFTGER